MQISIPNSSAGIDTQKLINDLMEAERQPIVRTENRIQESRDTIAIWRSVNNSMKLFQDNSKKLYGINNPFSERTINNSHPNLVDAQTKRNAAIGKYSIVIKAISTPDKWLSKEIANDYAVAQGKYIIRVGEEEVVINFSGSTINQLVEEINDQANTIVKANLIKKGTKNTEQVMVLEGLKKGKRGKIVLEGLAETLALDVGMIGPNATERPSIYLHTNYITSYLSDDSLLSNTTASPSANSNASDSTSRNAREYLVFHPGALAKFQVPVGMHATLLANNEATVHFKIYMRPAKANASSTAQSALASDVLAVELDSIIVQGEQAKSLQNTTTNKATAASTESEEISAETPDNITKANKAIEYKMLSMLFDNQIQSIYKIEKNEVVANTPHTFSIPASMLLQDNSFYFTFANPFPNYEIIIDDVSLSDNQTSSEYQPLAAVTEAQNAIVEFEGIDIERETNQIDDIIPGVNLNIFRANKDQPIDLDVLSDHETIKNDIIAYVGSYNQLTKDLLIFTRTERANSAEQQLLDVLTFASAEEKNLAEKNLGKLSGEFAITTLLNQLQTVVGGEYNAFVDANISSLRNIGIAPNLENNNAPSIIANNFLDIEETTLDNAIASNTLAIAKLFAADTNNDVIIDYGVAFRSSEAVQRYVEINGIISQRQKTITSQITRDQAELNRYNDRLIRYEQELRRKYGNMEQIVNQLNRSSNALNNLNGINQQDK